MKQKALSTKDILQLLMACKQSGVKEFTFQELHITFSELASAERVETSEMAVSEVITHSKTDEQEIQALNQFEAEKEDMALLMIDNPLEMERMIDNEELITNEAIEH